MLQPCEQRFPLVQWRIQTFRWGGEGGGGHPDPEIRGGGAGSKKFFWALHFGLEIRGGCPPGPLPWIRHCCHGFFFYNGARGTATKLSETQKHSLKTSKERTSDNTTNTKVGTDG